ncbi:uncharacterized protein [Rutidosis leptorrhynchoides]|uniref:uncharacterized protein n=1 Tax=Rutidosis leptorrhynchoides TaxID=125765 RepID=UPI003A9A6271
MAEEKSLIQIPRFDGHYDHWSELMENLIRSKGLWYIIEKGVEEPKEGVTMSDAEQKAYDSNRMKDHQVKHVLFQALDREVFEQILDRRNSKVVWESMKAKFGGNSKVKKSLLNSLRREFEVLAMKGDESIAEYFARVMAVSNKMRSNGEDMPDKKIVEKIMRTLTEKFTYVVVAIEEAQDTDTMSIDELQSSLVVHEQKFKRSSSEGVDHALKIEDFSGGRGRGRGRNSYRGRGRGRGRSGSFDKSTIECYKCHGLGHFQYECPQWSKEANYAEYDDQDQMLLMALEELESKPVKNIWFLDSGCSNHMCGDRGLKTLYQKNMVTGLPSVAADEIICDSCMKGKQHRLAIPKATKWRASEKLQQLHADLCGPITPASNSDKRYIFCIIDDFSRKTWVYFLKEKSEALHHFKVFKARVEKEADTFIKCLRTDRGGEFNSTEFNEFCKLNGIKRQLTTAYTPQQNGVAERKNRTIMNLVRSIMIEKDVPKTFWPEAVKWVNHVLNRSPTLAVKDVTPEEAWGGIKPSVDYFRVFGCIGHVHVPDAKRNKLENKSV